MFSGLTGMHDLLLFEIIVEIKYFQMHKAVFKIKYITKFL